MTSDAENRHTNLKRFNVYRRKLLQYLATVALPSTLFVAHAQDAAFPSKPIRIIVSSGAGTLTDQSARFYAEKMSAYLKQPIVIENIAGASSLLAYRQLLKAPADGYTLLSTANTLVIMPHLNSKAGYALKNFSGVGEMVRSPHLLVTSGASPFKSLPELIAAAKKNPENITYGISGVGTTNHISVELLAHHAGVKFSHVPYKGIAMAIPDVVAGRVNFMNAASNSVAELMKTGALRALAISSEKRSPQFPNIPTVKELGYPEATFEIWIGLVAPAGIPPLVKARLGEAMEAARADQDIVRRVATAGQEISEVKTPDQFEAVLRADEEKFRKLIKDANIVAE